MPNAVCEITPTNFAPNLLMTRKPPFDNPELRKAVAMTIDHQAFVDILGEGKGDIGTAVLPGPEGQWAMPKEMREQLPGYAPDVAKSREEARKIMQSLGYGPDKHLPLKISARNLPDYRDAASLLIDQLKQSISTPNSNWSKPRIGCRSWYARISSWRKAWRAPASTTPTRPSTRITAASRTATTRITAIPRSRR